MNDKLVAEGIVFDTSDDTERETIEDLATEVEVKSFDGDRYMEQITLFDLEVLR